MTRRGQYACVLAGLLVCLALTVGFIGSPQPVRKAPISGGDDIPFPTRDVPTRDTKSSSVRPRVPAAVVPEGVAVLLVMVAWTSCRAVLSGRLGHHPVRRMLTTLSRRQSLLLQKPFTPEALMQHMRLALDGSPPRG